MANTNVTSQNDAILNFLKSGQQLTEKQARGLFGVKSLSGRVSELRRQGYPVYRNTTKTTGAAAYRLGTPSRAMVAAAYASLGANAFS